MSSLKLRCRNPLFTISIRSRSMQTAASRISNSKRVFIWRSSNRLFSASSSPSKFVEEPKRRRVSKQERRAMLEEFVDSYRASNSGRFPTASQAKKEIGGSYYVARLVIQELVYNHRMSPKKSEKPVGFEKKNDVLESRTDLCTDRGEDALLMDGESVRLPGVKMPLISFDSEQALVKEPVSSSTSEIGHSNELVVEHVQNSSTSTQRLFYDHNDKKTVEMVYPSSLPNENSKDSVHESTEVQADSSVPLKSEAEVDILRTPVNDVEGTREEETSFESAKGGVEQRSNEEASISDELDSENPRMLVKGVPSPKRLGIWGNLRSLADGIISLWKKM